MDNNELAPKEKTSPVTNAVLKKALIILFSIAAVASLFVLSAGNYPLFHTFIDTLTVFIAVSVFALVWNGRRILDNHYYLYIGIAFLFFGILDFIHLLGNKGMGVFPQYGNLGPTFYIASRYLLSISLLIAPLFIRRKLNTTIALLVYALATGLVFVAVFYWHNFPATYIEGTGLTPFKVISDYIICGMIAVAIGLLWVYRQAFDAKILRLIIYALILSIATGLAFTLYTDPFGVINMTGHLLQIGSFYLMYRAIIETVLNKPQDILYYNLKQSQEAETQLNAELAKVNLELKLDIAERQKIEEDLKKYTRDLENVNKELEAFSYSVSHDLKAPLRSLNGFSEALMEDYADKLDAEGKDYLQRIRSSSQLMSRLIEDILTLSRVTRVQMNIFEVNLSELAEEVVIELKQSQPERQAEFKIMPNLITNGDRSLLKLVLDNLLGNAFKFTGKTQSAVIEFGMQLKEGKPVFYVKDNGVGFDMAAADKLFKPFQRLHSTAEFPGTGVGLASVLRIIRRHCGEVWAESREGEGAIFYFTLVAKSG
jgi:signal transduction histidine kinase